MKKTLLSMCAATLSLSAMAQDYTYTNSLQSAGDATVVGGGSFVSDDTFGTVFQNVATSPRSNYLLLPAEVFQHSGTSKAISIAFWVSADGITDDNSYTYAPLFSGYAAQATENSWPMMVLQTRGLAQVNCWGWCDFKGEQNAQGKNTIYHPNAWIEEGSTTEVHGDNWLADHKWHYYTAVFTSNGCTIYFDGTAANTWQFDEPGDGSWIDGFLTNYDTDNSDWLIKYICLGGNQAWNWGDNDAPLKFANLRIQNNAMTADDIATQMQTDIDNATAIKTVTTDADAQSQPQPQPVKKVKNGKLVIEKDGKTFTADGKLSE